MNRIACTDFEVLLADYIDRRLAADQTAAVERHMAACAECAELARDAAGAVQFMERAAAIQPPPVLVNRIMEQAARAQAIVRPSFFERMLGERASAIFQPRFAMGMAMAILSLSMAGRFWTAAENGMYRAWDRAVKGYEDMRLVYQVQSQLEQWGVNPAGERNRE
jgi:anti-sigma factor RsiW